MKKHLGRLRGALFVLALPCAIALAEGGPPVAPVRDQVDTWHGVQVHDPYRYMENLADPQVKSWVEAQGAYSRGLLDRIEGRAELEKRLAEIEASLGDRRFGITRMPGGAVFYLLRERKGKQVKLAMRASLGGAEKVLVDPDTYAQKTGVPHAINWFSPSWDGRYVAYGLSAGGSEDASMYILDVATGRQVGEPVPRVQWEAVSWTPDSRSVAYNQLRKLTAEDPATETYLDTTVYLLKVGDPAQQARPVFGPLVNRDLGLERLDNGYLVFTPGSPWVIAGTNDTTQKEGSVFMARVADLAAGGTVPWRRIASFADHLVEMELQGDTLYYRTKVDAPRFRIMKLDLRHPDLKTARVVALPPADGLIEGFVLGRDSLLAQVRRGASIGLTRYAGGNTAGQAIRLPFAGAASLAEDAAHAHADYVYALAGWTEPSRSFVLKGAHSVPLPQFDTSVKLAMPAIVVRDVLARSYDGTMVPLTILHRKGLALDGTNPTLLVGYGSYGTSETAGFRAGSIPWLEAGGVVAVANVRGGGVYGDAWRMAGTKLNKPNTWKDAIACGQYLVEKGYASPKTLAIMSGSAGGVFAGRAITEAPQLFAAAVIHVGMLDAIRAEDTANGITNISEFGSVKDAAGFKGLLEMSTYHQIKDGTPYPAVMFVHGLNDPRVDPWNSFKTAARMQAASSSGKPILLRIDAQAGHGIGSTPAQRRSVDADQQSFLLWQMGKRKLMQ
ncbi:MAG TPA: prolyl oligopeptidase family serine peptidase [Ramlibacter sp.]|uniref:prolyl oligopeptidase family serine peptidase n=1 Tax=Ramlibacter sp. TaxID=1917967 RepID=UPI002C6B145F|nr:prolyl oligopeptidase family serine peptidase [Ramlibacter sp.]HVZ44371.1 prolyl oligopeptidase family serine peptidase [Ramlibacter sp.]